MGVQFSIIFYSTIAGLSTVLGVMLVLVKERLVLKYSHYVNSFAAGLILGIAFFHLFPESLELSENALLFIFMGFLIFYLLENVMVIHSGSEIHFREKKNPQHSKGMVMFSGLFFHSLVDGIIIGVGFGIDPKLGLLTSLGVISHELPEGVTTFSLLIKSIKRKTALKLSVAVALATPLGALLSLTFIGSLSEAMIGLLLAMAGGSFLYIAASDLIPETHEEKRFGNAGFLLLGVLFLYLLSKTIEV
ncbi:MAG: ZIP family metal transporter [Desulfobacteraceae bacterium]|jgi:ZIP family zinc transporter/zinc and cadmium transporter|nr:ZIP family metal transporter [Desulfobacteraceae bacterium]